MDISVGIDIAREMHWMTAIDADGMVRLDREVPNAPAALAELAGELADLRGSSRIGLDVHGGFASLAEAILTEAGFALFHVPGLTDDHALHDAANGENSSNSRDARIIADRVRTSTELRRIRLASTLDQQVKLLVGRRRKLVELHAQRLSRLNDLLACIFPGLAACLDLTNKTSLYLLAEFVTPAEIRHIGATRLRHSLRAVGSPSDIQELVGHVLRAASEQAVSIPGERMTARLVRQLAAESLTSSALLIELDRQLVSLLRSRRCTAASSYPNYGRQSRPLKPRPKLNTT